MANKITYNPTVDDLKVLKKKLKRFKWEFEDYKTFVGFMFYCEQFYSTGKFGNFRCAIVDERIVFKFATGSRHIVEFNSYEESLSFWNSIVGLPIVNINIDLKFPKKSIVEIIRIPEHHQNFHDPIGKTLKVVGTLVDENGNPYISVMPHECEMWFTTFRTSLGINETYQAQGFSLTYDDVKLLKT